MFSPILKKFDRTNSFCQGLHRSQINGKKDFFPYISFYPSEQYIIKYLPNPKKGILSRGNILCKVRKIHSVVYSLYPYWRDTFWSKKYRNIFQKFKKKPILIQLWKRKIEFEDKNRFLLIRITKRLLIYVISHKLKLNTYGKSLFPIKIQVSKCTIHLYYMNSWNGWKHDYIFY